MGKAKVDVYDAFNSPPSGPSEIRCTQEEKRTVESDGMTDLNVMLKGLSPGEVLPLFGGKEPFYGDVSEVGDYRKAMETVEAADEAFMAQPPDIRNRFDNDAGKFLEFVMNDANREEAVKLGLIAAPVKAPDAPPAGGGA